MIAVLIIVALVAILGAVIAIMVAAGTDEKRIKAERIAEENRLAAESNAHIIKRQVETAKKVEVINAKQVEEIKAITTNDDSTNFAESLDILSNYSRRKSDSN